MEGEVALDVAGQVELWIKMDRVPMVAAVERASGHEGQADGGLATLGEMTKQAATVERGAPAPMRIGVLHDRPPDDGGESFERMARLGVDEVAASGGLDRPVEFVHEMGRGLPGGTARAVEDAFAALSDAGVLGIVGPAVSDNGLVARDLADAAKLPCINFTGGEQTRSEWMFHYQIGSLEDEPILVARALAARGVTHVAVVMERSPSGRRYAEFFEQVCPALGIEIVTRVGVSPVAQDLCDVVEGLRRNEPGALVYLGLGLSAYPLGNALRELDWTPLVAANSALMFGYAYPDFARLWEGWLYVDGVADDNRLLRALRERLGPEAAPGPALPSAYDLGRLVALGLGLSESLTRRGLRDGLERVKGVPAALGREGTTMGFGQWERSALKGQFLVVRQWVDGESVEVDG